MKFERITNEAFGAKLAGYRIDFGAERQYDDALFERLRKIGHGNYIEDMKDSLYDMEGDLYRGDDGEYYIVAFDYRGDEPQPVMWHRLVKDGGANAQIA